MIPIITLIIGTTFLLLLLNRFSFQIPLRLRMQAVIISSFLVLLTLLLASFYTWQIAVLAFVGFFLLFVVVMGKQLEYELEQNEEEAVLEQEESEEIPIAATAGKEEEVEVEAEQWEEAELTQASTLVDEATIHEENVIEQTEHEDNYTSQEPNNEDELLDFFENRPRQILTVEEEVDEEVTESEEDSLPIRVPSQDNWMDDEEVIRRPGAELDEYDEQTENPEAIEEKDFIAVRKRLFEELENDHKRTDVR